MRSILYGAGSFPLAECLSLASYEEVYGGYSETLQALSIATGEGASRVLMNPSVDVAVLETARGGILRAGLAYDQCDVAVVTNIGEGDHLGLSDIRTIEELAVVKRTVV